MLWTRATVHIVYYHQKTMLQYVSTLTASGLLVGWDLTEFSAQLLHPFKNEVWLKG